MALPIVVAIEPQPGFYVAQIRTMLNEIIVSTLYQVESAGKGLWVGMR